MLTDDLEGADGTGRCGRPDRRREDFHDAIGFQHRQLAVRNTDYNPSRGSRCLVLRQRFGGGHQHHAGKSCQLSDLIFCSEHLPILLTRMGDADRAPQPNWLILMGLSIGACVSALTHVDARTQTVTGSMSRMIFFWMAYCTSCALLWMSSLRIRLNLCASTVLTLRSNPGGDLLYGLALPPAS